MHFTKTYIQQCKVEIERHIYHCGFLSHASPVAGGHASYVEELSDSDRRNMFESKSYQFGFGQMVRGLQVNHTAVYNVVFAGSITNDGSCSGSSLADPYGS